MTHHRTTSKGFPRRITFFHLQLRFFQAIWQPDVTIVAYGVFASTGYSDMGGTDGRVLLVFELLRDGGGNDTEGGNDDENKGTFGQIPE